MVTASEILTKVNGMIADEYQQNTVYLNFCPSEFTRPAFLVKCIRASRYDADRSTVKNRVYCSITYFGIVDTYSQENAMALVQVQDTVMNMFRSGYIKVGERVIKVIYNAGGVKSDCSFVDLRFEYSDNRFDTEDSTLLMQEINTKISKEE